MKSKKKRALAEERNNCCSTYQTESDLIDLGYDFAATRKIIADIDDEVGRLKHALNVANATVIVPDFNKTIGECLVYMAQLNNEKHILETMASRKAKSRITNYGGVVEFTITNYDIEECKIKLGQLNETIRRLQIALDRINLEHMCEF